MGKIRYESINVEYVDEALQLVLSEYMEEKMAVAILPDTHEFIHTVRESIENLFKCGTGVAAFSNEELVGFISGFRINELFGKCKGVYSPLYGHGVRKENGNSIYQGLYQNAAEMWVKDGYLTHALTFFAHEAETINTWFWMGFGMRCVDAIRKVDSITVQNGNMEIKKCNVEDISDLAEIHSQHCIFYRKSPVFMLKPEEDPVRDLAGWLGEENHHLWAAYKNGIPMGYMRIEPGGESFVSEHPSVMNITGAFVYEDGRNSGIGTLLLSKIQEWLKQNDYPLCGVDFESINTVGSKFWKKYFAPYTYSLVRRIDERIL